jgi:uncharacterized protein YqgC (DUF456 family)
MELALWTVAFLAVAAGVAGTVLPALPGPSLVWLGLLAAAWADGFERVGGGTLAVTGLLALATFGVDYAATALGARRVGASRAALVGAVVGTFAGLPFGLPGLLVGPFAGAAAGEIWQVRDWRRAGKVGLGAALGFALGVAAKLGIVAAMLALFALAYFV